MKKLLILILISTSTVSYAQFEFSEKHFGFEADSMIVDELFTADMNGDNLPDFVGSIFIYEDIYIAFNNFPNKPELVKIENSVFAQHLTVYDFDQDGDQDIIGSSNSDNKSYIWRNDGGGNFERVTLLDKFYYSIHFANVVGDDKNEMILAASGSFELYEINGNNVSLLQVLESNFFFEPTVIKTFDFNNDGMTDIVTGDFFNGIDVFLNSSSDQFTKSSVNSSVTNISEMVIAEENDDSIKDYYLIRGDAPSLLLSNTDGSYEEVPFTNDIFGLYQFSNFNDVDGDGDLDCMVFESTGWQQGEVILYTNNNNEFSREIVSSNYGNSESGGIADIDQDGDQDIYIWSRGFDNSGVYFLLNNEIADNDNDGYLSNEDCDDNNPNVNPGQTEVVYNGIDDDCDAETLDDDLDQDGFALIDDCDDENSDINPDATDIPNNGIDEDCNGEDLVNSVYNFENRSINIFPNPTSSIVNLKVSGFVSFQATIYDVTGTLIFQTDNVELIDFSNYHSGIFFLHLRNLEDDSFIVERIQVVK